MPQRVPWAWVVFNLNCSVGRGSRSLGIPVMRVVMNSAAQRTAGQSRAHARESNGLWSAQPRHCRLARSIARSTVFAYF